MNKHKISLQINVSPGDLAICKMILGRQINFWYEELDEIVLSIESQKSYGRFALDFDKNKEALLVFVEKMTSEYPKTRAHFIDYSPERSQTLAALFFTGGYIPHKDYHGGPFYCYFDGLAACHNRYIMHLDSDMLLGGIPNTWLQDAVDLLNTDPAYFIVNPLPGPPSENCELKQEYLQRLDKYKFLFRKMSTRVFLLDREKFLRHKITLRKVSPSLSSLKWYFKNGMNRGYELPEILISEMMNKNNLFRVDTLGERQTDACFTLHAVNKPDRYIESIPLLLDRMDRNDIPDSQRGHYNIHNDFFDFRKAK
jgi:hypothetical protein